MASRKSQIVIYRNYQEFEDCAREVMQFRLTYEGPLKPSGNNTSYGFHKHDIRKAFHPQLKALWEKNPNLKQVGDSDYRHFLNPHSYSNTLDLIGEERTVLEALADNNPLQDYKFVPLVSDELSLTCGIEVLFLRYGAPGDILRNGDIDNRMKTLIDALQRPTQLQEIGSPYRLPDQDEHPFYVLLENDRLVSKFSVETDVMLDPLIGGPPEDSDARLVITVTVRPTNTTLYNLALG